MIDCIIFDCDGTLVDSEYLCTLGLEIKLKEYGVVEDANSMMSRFQGAKLALIIEKLEAENQIKFDGDYIPSYRDIVDHLFEEHLSPSEGVFEMLESIQLPICVASSGPREKIHKALSLTGLLKHFNDNIFSSYDIRSWKPDPAIFTHAAKEMGFCASQCAVVEDSPVGLRAAVLAGAIPIHYNPNGVQNLVDDVYKISHMTELKALISSISQ